MASKCLCCPVFYAIYQNGTRSLKKFEKKNKLGCNLRVAKLKYVFVVFLLQLAGVEISGFYLKKGTILNTILNQFKLHFLNFNKCLRFIKLKRWPQKKIFQNHGSFIWDLSFTKDHFLRIFEFCVTKTLNYETWGSMSSKNEF